MPRHLELIESCASCLPHGNSVSSVACDLLYKTTNLFLPYPSDGDRWFSLTVVSIKPLYIENYHMRNLYIIIIHAIYINR